MTTGQATKLYKLDPTVPYEIGEVRAPFSHELDGQVNMKYAAFEKAVLASNPYVSLVLRAIPTPKRYKRLLVDVKVKDLKAGQIPCLPGWHLDCTMEPDRDGLPETHFLFVAGAGCKTRFVVSPVEIPIKNGRLVNVDKAIKEQSPDIFTIKECTVTRYNRYNLHAPSPAEYDGRRLLVRISCCDFIKPNPIR
jgi:hypothetical protein